MPKENINNVEIYYDLKEGKNETIAFLNGVAMNTTLWKNQIDYFKNNNQILLHDFRGQGQSSLKLNNFTFDQHVEDFYSLLEKLDIEKVHIVGVSYGAEVAMHFALKYPDKINTLTLGTAVSEVKPLLKAQIESWIMTAKTYNGKLFYKVMSPFVYSNYFYEENSKWLEKRAEKFGENVSKDWLDAFVGLCNNFLSLDITDDLSKINIPTLIVSGKEDILKPPSYGKIINQNIKNSKFEIVDRAAHGLFAEKPAEFNQLIKNFIKNQ